MMEPHAPTAFLVTVAVNVALATSLAAAGSRANRDGLFLSAIAMLLYSLAFGIFGLRGEINDVTLLIVAATTLSASWAMFAEGLLQFQQRQRRHGLIWLPVIIILIVFLLFRDNIQVRIIISSVIYCAQVILILVILNQGRRSTVGRGQYFIAIGLAPIVPVFAFRGFLAATDQAEKVLMLVSNQIQAMIFLISIVSTMFVAIGMLIMSKELSEGRSQPLSRRDAWHRRTIPVPCSRCRGTTYVECRSQVFPFPGSVEVMDPLHSDLYMPYSFMAATGAVPSLTAFR